MLSSRRDILGAGATIVAGGLLVSNDAQAAVAAERPALARSSSTTLIRCGAVLTMKPGEDVHHNADILIRDGKIVAIARDLPSTAHTIDARRMVAIPGFVDGHRHLWEGVLRDTLPSADLGQYIARINNGAGPAFRPEDAYLGTLISALGAIDAGVTTVMDWSHIQNSRQHTDAVIAAIRKSGIRAVFGYGPALRTDLGAQWPSDLLELKKREFSSSDDLVTLALATVSPESMPAQTVRDHLQLAREADVLVTMHAGIDGIGTPGEIGKLGRAGLLGPDVNLVHCNVLDPDEWKILAETKTTVTLTPFIEMMMGHGDPAIQQARDVGMLFSLGADVETSGPGDMWSQMRTAFAFQRAAAFRSRHTGRRVPAMMLPREALDYAIRGGALATRLDKKIGTLEPGKSADIVLLDLGAANDVPVTDVESAILLNMDARNVDSVFINGVAMKRDGALLGVNLAELGRKLRISRNRILGQI